MVAFVVVIISLLLQGWTLAPAARRLHVALPRAERGPRRVELVESGQVKDSGRTRKTAAGRNAAVWVAVAD